MKRTILFSLLLAVVLTLGTSAFAATTIFKTIPSDKKNVVQFTSESTLETIVGNTSAISGQVDVNLDDLVATTSGQMDVDLNTIDTGIEMRNGHMRDNFLQTKDYPKATFVLKKFTSAEKKSLAPGETVHVVAVGDFTIHGVSKEYQIPLTLSYSATNPEVEQRMYGSKGNLLAVSADWMVKLADHKIDRPQMLFMRLAEEQKVSVRFVMTDVLPEKK